MQHSFSSFKIIYQMIINSTPSVNRVLINKGFKETAPKANLSRKASSLWINPASTTTGMHSYMKNLLLRHPILCLKFEETVKNSMERQIKDYYSFWNSTHVLLIVFS